MYKVQVLFFSPVPTVQLLHLSYSSFTVTYKTLCFIDLFSHTQIFSFLSLPLYRLVTMPERKLVICDLVPSLSTSKEEKKSNFRSGKLKAHTHVTKIPSHEYLRSP
jgi:hypothetical protein